MGRESHSQALPSWPGGHGEKGTSCLLEDGEKTAGLGSPRHWICPVFGNECRVSPHSHLRLPFLSAEGGRALWLNWLPLLFCTASPSSFSGKGHSWASLLASSAPPCNFFLSHTCPGSFLENCLPLTYSDAQTRADPREAVTFPGRCLQVLKK